MHRFQVRDLAIGFLVIVVFVQQLQLIRINSDLNRIAGQQLLTSQQLLTAYDLLSNTTEIDSEIVKLVGTQKQIADDKFEQLDQFRTQIYQWQANSFYVLTNSDPSTDRYLYVGEIPKDALPGPLNGFYNRNLNQPLEVILFDANHREIDRFNIGPYLKAGDAVVAWYAPTSNLSGLPPVSPKPLNVQAYFWDKKTGLAIGIKGINGYSTVGKLIRG